jgi:hypothetical protein
MAQFKGKMNEVHDMMYLTRLFADVFINVQFPFPRSRNLILSKNNLSDSLTILSKRWPSPVLDTTPFSSLQGNNSFSIQCETSLKFIDA